MTTEDELDEESRYLWSFLDKEAGMLLSLGSGWSISKIFDAFNLE